MFRTLGRVLARFEKRPSATRSAHRSQEFPVERPSPKYALLVCPAIAFGLGCWQIRRREWKTALIDTIDAKTKAPPVELPSDLRDLDDMEYQTVRVRGVFDHDEEVYIGPRGDVEKGGIGFFVITPLKLEDRDYSILINRGWVPREKTNPATRREGQIPGVVEIEGVVRKSEPKPIASKEIRSGAFFAVRDIDMLAQTLGTAPVYIDAARKSSIPGGPLGGQTRVNLRNEHLSYILTWFSLSAATLLMWYKKYGKGVRF
ncbi:surfeit locus protein 1 isoform X1 [Galendromus occidentalis]|uniref:SURF1-like protein n=1 Tax=Galendromus occidentalis TaxID=34638 RepID=A0AAJ7L748_9ACAR|nr:surfeit locus protein 1 isoform X1 [Galendromus occidentalis]